MMILVISYIVLCLVVSSVAKDNYGSRRDYSDVSRGSRTLRRSRTIPWFLDDSDYYSGLSRRRDRSSSRYSFSYYNDDDYPYYYRNTDSRLPWKTYTKDKYYNSRNRYTNSHSQLPRDYYDYKKKYSASSSSDPYKYYNTKTSSKYHSAMPYGKYKSSTSRYYQYYDDDSDDYYNRKYRSQWRSEPHTFLESKYLNTDDDYSSLNYYNYDKYSAKRAYAKPVSEPKKYSSTKSYKSYSEPEKSYKKSSSYKSKSEPEYSLDDDSDYKLLKVKYGKHKSSYGKQKSSPESEPSTFVKSGIYDDDKTYLNYKVLPEQYNTKKAYARPEYKPKVHSKPESYSKDDDYDSTNPYKKNAYKSYSEHTPNTNTLYPKQIQNKYSVGAYMNDDDSSNFIKGTNYQKIYDYYKDKKTYKPVYDEANNAIYVPMNDRDYTTYTNKGLKGVSSLNRRLSRLQAFSDDDSSLSMNHLAVRHDPKALQRRIDALMKPSPLLHSLGSSFSQPRPFTTFDDDSSRSQRRPSQMGIHFNMQRKHVF